MRPRSWAAILSVALLPFGAAMGAWAQPPHGRLSWLVRESGSDRLAAPSPPTRWNRSYTICSSATQYGHSYQGAPTEPSQWSPAAAYGLELGSGVILSSISAAGSAVMIYSASGERYENMWIAVSGFPAFVVTSALLTATSTYLVGKLAGRPVSWSRALLGGAAGGLGGAVSMFAYFSTPGRGLLIPVTIAAPPAGAVLVSNLWRN